MTHPTAPNESTEPATKIVAVRLAALTRVEYLEYVRVPADMSETEMTELVDRRYDTVDGGLYYGDPDYWERGTCSAQVDEDPSRVARVSVERDGAGNLRIEAMNSHASEVCHVD